MEVKIPDGNVAGQINIKVLTYYRVVENEGSDGSHWSFVNLAQLQRQMELLSSWGFTPITFKDYLLCSKGDLSLPKKPVILTFENGYRNTYKYAFPTLKKFGINAVIFALGDRSIKTDDWNEHLGLSPKELVLDEELIEMQEAGFEIGSHSLTHATLTSLSDNEAQKEITFSKEILESILHSRVSSFSYPFGAVDHRIKQMVRNAGYKIACGLDAGLQNLNTDLFNIKRIIITRSTNTCNFAIKMLAPYDIGTWFGSKVTENIQSAMTE